ncbi:MAG: MBL fold metallo-hydrolase [Brevinema sp.]
MVQLTFLGTGTSSGIPMIGCSCKTCLSNDFRDKRQRCAVLLNIGTKKILIDAGPDIRQQLIRHRVTSIDALLLTHPHYDHIIGIDELRPLTRDKIIPIFADQKTNQHLKTIFPYLFDQHLQKKQGLTHISLTEIHEYQYFSFEGIEILPLRVLHGCLPILGYKINNIAYLTDVKTLPDTTIDAIKNIDTLVISCLREEAHETHLNRQEMESLVEKINPNICYLIHMDHAVCHEEWIQRLPKRILLSYDNLQITIP